MKKRLIIIFLLFILVNILINSSFIINNIYDYTNLFIKNLFFNTFIIYIISSLLIDNGLLDILNPIIFTNVISMISGFPSGIKYSKELLDKEYINKDCANYLVTFCHYPNPLFIIGSVSTIIGMKSAIFILISIYISNFIVSRIFKYRFNITTNYIYRKSNYNFMTSLNNSIMNAFKTILLIYGTSVISLVILLIIINVIKPTNIIYSIISGIFDLTKGIFSTILINNKRIRVYLILMFITFGSLNIHLQVRSICNKDINYKYFLFGRLLSTLLVIIINIVYNLLG